MGTQQILYIVVGVIIIGIAIIVGTLPNFIKGMESANMDAVTQDCMKLAAAAQGYYRRPGLFSGGGSSFRNITITDCGMEENDDGEGENDNGTFDVDGSAGDVCVITGYSNTVPGATVTVTVSVGEIEDPEFEGWDE